MTRPKSTALPLSVRVPFIQQLGLELHAIGTGHSEWRVDLTDRHHNSRAVAHGGMVMTLLDVAMATAARGGTHAPGATTIEMKTSFMRPAVGEVYAIGKLLHRSTSLVFCEAHLYNANNELCASATGTFKTLRPAHAPPVHIPSGSAAPASSTHPHKDST